MKNNKIILQYQDSEEDLNELLENSFYKKNKPESKSNMKSLNILSFNEVYALIKQMRKYKNAPVDKLGPQTLFLKDAPKELQRFQILTSLMLSPQTKDEVTAMCMKRLLDYQIKDIAQMEVVDLKNIIFEVNFNLTKAQRIKSMAELALVKGMPDSYEKTLEIKGVGEKIGIIYMLIAFNQIHGVPVDVNMIRICNRVGLVRDNSPRKVKEFLEKELDKKEWGKVNKILVGFGQQICLPNGREKCSQCLMKAMCEYYKNKYEQKNK